MQTRRSSIFVEAYGRRFDFARQQIKDLRLSATTKAARRWTSASTLNGSGLAGLADVGVFKSKEEEGKK